jgi:hypothetical protein
VRNCLAPTITAERFDHARHAALLGKTQEELQRRLVALISQSYSPALLEDGTVYFRGGSGAKAWARSLIRADG